MSDSAVLEHFRVTQGGRFFTIYPDEQAIDMKTALVSALGPNNFTWTSSLTRADTGAGACELFYVESLERR